MTNSRILIVDDQSVNIMLLERALRAGGFEDIITTTDSPTAVVLVIEQNPDLLLLDLSMPKMSGIDVLNAIREYRNQRPFPVIVVTSETDSELRQNATTAGADYIISKPFTRQELLAKVNQYLQ